MDRLKRFYLSKSDQDRASFCRRAELNRDYFEKFIIWGGRKAIDLPVYKTIIRLSEATDGAFSPEDIFYEFHIRQVARKLRQK